jgi:hypothetical protein
MLTTWWNRSRISRPLRSVLVSAGAAVVLAAALPAQALTIVLNVVNGPTTDRAGVGTLPETFASWGFTTMDLDGVRQATLAAVIDHYLGYPTFGTNALSPLPDGKELNINFTFRSATA